MKQKTLLIPLQAEFNSDEYKIYLIAEGLPTEAKGARSGDLRPSKGGHPDEYKISQKQRRYLR